MSIWNEAIVIAEIVFKITNELPKKEDYGFTSQIRRSSLSISGNIAEAYGRNHLADKMNFYYYSRGSLTETQSHLEYGFRVEYINEENFNNLNDSLEKLHKNLNKVIASLKIKKKL
ncbi:MAG: four helix bundle protein [Acidobacteriota bacterium]